MTYTFLLCGVVVRGGNRRSKSSRHGATTEGSELVDWLFSLRDTAARLTCTSGLYWRGDFSRRNEGTVCTFESAGRGGSHSSSAYSTTCCHKRLARGRSSSPGVEREKTVAVSAQYGAPVQQRNRCVLYRAVSRRYRCRRPERSQRVFDLFIYLFIYLLYLGDTK